MNSGDYGNRNFPPGKNHVLRLVRLAVGALSEISPGQGVVAGHRREVLEIETRAEGSSFAGNDDRAQVRHRRK